MNKENVFDKIESFRHRDVDKKDGLVRIMTSNIYYTLDETEEETEKRMEILGGYYMRFLPDFLGLQEVSRRSRPLLLKQISEKYAYTQVIEGKSNYTPLMYRKDLYDVLETDFKIFEGHDGSMWSYQWALYSSKEVREKQIIHMNLHYHFASTETRLKDAEEVNRKIKELMKKYPTAPIFVTGDYNCGVSTPEFKAMCEGIKLNSGMLLTDDNDGYKSFWHHPGEYEIAEDTEEIDHICVTEERARVVLHRKIRDRFICIEGSDHCPVYIDVEI
ncbi:MAG: hypothetical protein E7641_00615 [Ruminococcaceae bacterium]|nr:hypothetical protein [Oscillospiraceae bacterium]